MTAVVGNHLLVLGHSGGLTYRAPLFKVVHAIDNAGLDTICIDKPTGHPLLEIGVNFEGFRHAALPNSTFGHLLKSECS